MAPYSPLRELRHSQLSTSRTPRTPQRRSVANRPIACVSIDFGTTFSAIAFACYLNPEFFKQDDLILHPSKVMAQGFFLDFGNPKKRNEIPSILAYNRQTGEHYFGLEIETAKNLGKIIEEDTLSLLKLLVARRCIIPEDIRGRLNRRIGGVRRLDPKTGRRARSRPQVVELISDCLRKLWENATWNLKETHPLVPIDSWDIRLVLCIPAIWEPREENIMREAARLAGIPFPEFVSEPEGAAGLYFGEVSEPIDETDAFLTCDAGGGTVDCITYLPCRIKPLLIQELVTSSGSACGSFNLNYDTRAELPNLLSDVLPDILSELNLTQSEFIDRVIDAFEEKKKDYNGFAKYDPSGGNMHLEINGLRRREARHVILEKNRLIIKKETMMKIFNKTTCRIHELVRDQIRTSHEELNRAAGELGLNPDVKIKYIVLVGGFGGSPHLQESLKIEFLKNKSMEYPIHVVYPMSPATAIVRGAILRATNKSFVSVRRSRMFIGFTQHDLYDPKIHKHCSPRFDEYDNLLYAYNRIHWLLLRNEPIPLQGFERKWDSRRTLPVKEGDFTFIQVLYGSRTHVEEGTSIKSAQGKKHIYELGELKADMSEFPDWHLFQPRPAACGDESLTCYEFDYRLRINVDGTIMKYEMMIPPMGIFPDGDADTWDDSDWFRKEAQLDLTSYIN